LSYFFTFDEYKKINPYGKIPALDTGSQVIAESELINEYFEDKFPEKPLLPKDPEGKAKVRSFTRMHDLYLDPPMRAVFPKLFGQEIEQSFIDEKMSEIQGRLDQLESQLSDGGWAAGSDFTLADAALTPTIFFMNNFLPAFGQKPALEGRPKLAAWWGKVQERESTKKALAEQGAALAALQKQQQGG
jgi:glutathione S-transferase